MLVCPLCRLTLSDNETTCPRDGHEGVDARPPEVPAPVRARFSVVEPYGRGASGDLFLADDQQTSRRGVLKLLRLPARVTPAERARLKRELVKQATLGPGALSVPLATGDAGGSPWIFREWHEGVSLKVKLARGGALAVQEALAIAAQIASALDQLHRSGLLHRDLKPGHVIVAPQPSGVPRVTVIDAGIAARIETDAVFAVAGTPEYVSPEQAAGKLVSFRSDLYALGCVLYEMLTGTPPFTGTPEELLKAHVEQPAPTPQVSMPTGVSTLLSQLLSKEARERPFSAQQVRRALEPFLPQDASSKREATQTFEKLTERRRAPAAGSGTLRPPRSAKRTAVGMPAQKKSAPPPPPPGARKKTSIPPPPPGGRKQTSVPPPPPGAPRRDPTMELSPLDLEEAESALQKPRAPKKTLMGMPAQPPAGAGASASASASADTTQELTALDLEKAESVEPPTKAPRVAKTMLGMPAAKPPTGGEGPKGGADGASAAAEERERPRKPAVLGSLTGEPTGGAAKPARDHSERAFAATEAVPQTTAADVRAGQPAASQAGAPTPVGATARGAPAAPASGPPPWEAKELTPSDPPPGAAPDDEGLDYDDLAETVAFDREAHESGAAGGPGAPAPAAGSAPIGSGVAGAAAPGGAASSSGAAGASPAGSGPAGLAGAAGPGGAASGAGVAGASAPGGAASSSGAAGASPAGSGPAGLAGAAGPGGAASGAGVAGASAPAGAASGAGVAGASAPGGAASGAGVAGASAPGGAASGAGVAGASAPGGAASGSGMAGADELEAGGRVGAAAASTPGGSGPAAAASTEPAAATAAPVAEARSRRSTAGKTLPLVALAAVAGFCLLAPLVGGVGWWLLSPSEPEPIVSAVEPTTPSSAAPAPTPPAAPPPAPAVEPAPTAPAGAPPAVAAPAADAAGEAAAEGAEDATAVEGAEEATAAQGAEDATAAQGAEGAAAAEGEAEQSAANEPAAASAERAGARRPRERDRSSRGGSSSSSGASRLQRFQRLREQALAHFRAQRFGQAARAYEQATQLNPRHAGSFAGLGASRLALGQPRRAVRAYQRAVSLRPRHAGFHAALGRAYHAAGDRNRARQSYQRALALDPRNQAARRGLQGLGG
jgi:serine/threonine-protein kinase